MSIYLSFRVMLTCALKTHVKEQKKKQICIEKHDILIFYKLITRLLMRIFL